MTQEQLNSNGFVANIGNRCIEPMTYRDYLDKYGRDLCTSPRGVCDRQHIREVEGADGIHYQMWSWGANGNRPYFTGTSFYSREDAELCLYRRRESYVLDMNSDAPPFYTTYEEAVEDLTSGSNPITGELFD